MLVGSYLTAWRPGTVPLRGSGVTSFTGRERRGGVDVDWLVSVSDAPGML